MTFRTRRDWETALAAFALSAFMIGVAGFIQIAARKRPTPRHEIRLTALAPPPSAQWITFVRNVVSDRCYHSHGQMVVFQGSVIFKPHYSGACIDLWGNCVIDQQHLDGQCDKSRMPLNP